MSFYTYSKYHGEPEIGPTKTAAGKGLATPNTQPPGLGFRVLGLGVLGLGKFQVCMRVSRNFPIIRITTF